MQLVSQFVSDLVNHTPEPKWCMVLEKLYLYFMPLKAGADLF